jgi:hypothetical protein
MAQDLRKTQKWPQKSLKVKDHYQLFMCIVAYVYNYSMRESQIRRRQKALHLPINFLYVPHMVKNMLFRVCWLTRK